MQIHVVDSVFRFVKIHFMTVFGPDLWAPVWKNEPRQGQGQGRGQGQGQDHEKVRRRRAALQLQMVLTLTLALPWFIFFYFSPLGSQRVGPHYFLYHFGAWGLQGLKLAFISKCMKWMLRTHF